MASSRGARTAEPFVSERVSPSRVNAYLSCGEAFRMKYVEGIPEQMSGSAALFGTVMHDALEHWAPNRTQDLVRLVAQSWMRVTEGTPVVGFIGAYQRLSVEAMKLERAIRDDWASQGKESKSPRMTAVWKKSPVAQEIDALIYEWLPKLRAESPWRFSDRDPLPTLYDESLIVAKKYSRKWSHLPPPLYTEFGFDVEWRGFTLHGYIDTIEPVFADEEGEIEAYLVNDYKSYAKEPAEQKDWRQVTMYDVAVRDMIERGALDLDPNVRLITCIDYLRLLERRYWEIGQADHDKLFSELSMYRTGVDAGVFLPASKNSNPDFCSYPENCCLRTKGEGVGCRIDFNQEID